VDDCTKDSRSVDDCVGPSGLMVPSSMTARATLDQVLAYPSWSSPCRMSFGGCAATAKQVRVDQLGTEAE
jgi:hypothetical protein